MSSIRLENIGRSFSEGGQQLTVLKSLNLDVRSGESVALRGRSGSGKSTLLNLISGIDAPESGKVWLGGQELTGMTERARTLFRRQHIGFVYQSFNLVPTLTVADNIRFILELNRWDRQTADARVASLLESVDLLERSESYPDVLSGGEQQRVALARAIAHQPMLLLADEPTGNLDDSSAEKVLQLIDKLRREQGSTLIMATHSAAIADRCDRVIELKSGRVAEPR